MNSSQSLVPYFLTSYRHFLLDNPLFRASAAGMPIAVHQYSRQIPAFSGYDMTTMIFRSRTLIDGYGGKVALGGQWCLFFIEIH